MELILLALLTTSFGVLAAAQVALVVGLLGREPRWRALVALLLPPLAPFWGYEEKFRTRVALWLGALVVYLACLTAAAV